MENEMLAQEKAVKVSRRIEQNPQMRRIEKNENT